MMPPCKPENNIHYVQYLKGNEMSDNLKTWPARIYIQHTDDDEPMPFNEASRYPDEVTWCDVRQFKADVEYVRTDLAAAATGAAPMDRQAISHLWYQSGNDIYAFASALLAAAATARVEAQRPKGAFHFSVPMK